MDFDFDIVVAEEEVEQSSKEPEIPLSVHTSQGLRYQKLHLFSKAIDCFDAGLNIEPNNENCRLGRIECLLSLARFSDAKREAEEVLESNPGSSRAKALKADAEYLLGDFEQAFITHNRARKTRPNFDAFRVGQQECERAIENALGPYDTWLDEEDVSDMTELLSKDLDDVKDQNEAKDLQMSKTSNRPRLYSDDVKCLKLLLSDKALETVHPECESLLDFLRSRQRFWRCQKPNSYKMFTKLYSSINCTASSHLKH